MSERSDGAVQCAEQRIDIAFGTSREYAPHMAAGIASIVRFTKPAGLRFIILHEGISEERQAEIESVAPGACFYWRTISDTDVPQYCNREHFSRPILYRLALDKLAPLDCRRVIYLDTDLLLCRDIRELWATDLGGYSLAAVIDCNIDPRMFAEKWKLKKPSVGYLNSGVLIVDLDRVRAERSFAAAMKFVSEHGHECLYADQDALNYVFWNHWRMLAPRWNAQRYMVVPALSKELPQDLQFHHRLPAVVHFTGPEKPWDCNGYHPWAWLYWRHIRSTPFAREIAAKGRIGRLLRLRYWLRWLYRKPTHSSVSLEREIISPPGARRAQILF